MLMLLVVLVSTRLMPLTLMELYVSFKGRTMG
jgi:hypothetical protein